MPVSTFPLPTVEEVRAEIPRLLVASGELSPRRPHGDDGELLDTEIVYSVLRTLSPAWNNIDFEPDLTRLETLERHYFERQIERARRDSPPWVLSELSIASLADWSIQDGDEPWGLLCLEVPVFTTDRRRAVLRGQRCEASYAEDFEHWFEKVEGEWRLTSLVDAQ